MVMRDTRGTSHHHYTLVPRSSKCAVAPLFGLQPWRRRGGIDGGECLQTAGAAEAGAELVGRTVEVLGRPNLLVVRQRTAVRVIVRKHALNPGDGEQQDQ